MNPLELKFLLWALGTLVTMLIGVFAYFGKKADKHLESIAESVNELKIEVAKVITKHEGLEKRMDRIEKKVL